MDFGLPTLIELPDLRSHAALAAELGLQFVELNMSFPQYQREELSPALLNGLREEYGVYFTVHLDESLDVTSPNRAIARVYREDVLSLLELAGKAAIPSLNMHLLRGVYVTLPERRTYVYAENEERYLSDLRTFREEVTAAAPKGTFINVENTDGYLPFHLRGLDTLLESPAFGLTYDIGHDHAIRGADRPVIEKRAERLHHMHMHDAVGTRVHLALGDGEMNIPAYLALAGERGCRVVLETKTAEALRSSVTYLKNL